MTGDVMRHRHRFCGIVPTIDRGGLWMRVTWAFWTWDYLPPAIGHRVCSMLAELRGGQ